MKLAVVVVLCFACVSSQHAEVKLANNPDGAECFSRCVQSTQEQASVDCVAACPGAMHDSGGCDDNSPGCVEFKHINGKGTTWLTIAIVATVLILVGISAAGG